MFDNILLAVDGSDHTHKTAKVVSNLARFSRGILRVIATFDELPHYLGEPNLSNAIAERAEKSDKILSEAVNEIGEIPGKC